MEDLTPRALTVGVLPGFTDAQVLALVAEVARVHAVSWQNPDWLRLVGTDPINVEFIETMRDHAFKLCEASECTNNCLIQ